ncbi:34417_t:CDS:2, partial [Racocetra persica]
KEHVLSVTTTPVNLVKSKMKKKRMANSGVNDDLVVKVSAKRSIGIDGFDRVVYRQVIDGKECWKDMSPGKYDEVIVGKIAHVVRLEGP